MAPLVAPDPSTGAALLVARSPRPLTAREALAWCWPVAGNDDVVGFGYALDSCAWWRLVDGVPTNPDGTSAELTGVYELVAFDGRRELRWLEDLTTGPAVVLAEDAALMPPEREIANPDGGPWPLRRLAGTSTRSHLLAGRVRGVAEACGWVELRSDRLAPASIPYRWPAGQPPLGEHLSLHYVEYVHEDAEGNLTVVDSRLTAVHVHRDEPVSGMSTPTGDDR